MMKDRHSRAHGRPVIALMQTAATILAPSGANLTYRMSLATEIAKGTT